MKNDKVRTAAAAKGAVWSDVVVGSVWRHCLGPTKESISQIWVSTRSPNLVHGASTDEIQKLSGRSTLRRNFGEVGEGGGACTLRVLLVAQGSIWKCHIRIAFLCEGVLARESRVTEMVPIHEQGFAAKANPLGQGPFHM